MFGRPTIRELIAEMQEEIRRCDAASKLRREEFQRSEETRAQTQALLRLIDRMDEAGGAAAA